MAKWKVKCSVVGTQTVVVEADSLEDATDAAVDQIELDGEFGQISVTSIHPEDAEQVP